MFVDCADLTMFFIYTVVLRSEDSGQVMPILFRVFGESLIGRMRFGPCYGYNGSRHSRGVNWDYGMLKTHKICDKTKRILFCKENS